MEGPAMLGEAEEKSAWSHPDIFEDKPFAFVSAFVHKRYAIGMHTHSFYEINVVLGGTGRHYVENHSCPVSRGCVFVIPPGIRHGYWQERELDVFHLLISRAFFERYGEELRALPGYPILFDIEPRLRIEFEESMFLTLNDEQMAGLDPYLRELTALQEESYGGRDILRNAAAMGLVGRLCALTSAADRPRPQAHRPEAAALLDVMEFMQRHLGDRLTVDELAGRCHMSRSTFLRHFRRLCRRSPMEYLAECRVRQAREWLSATDRPAADIALACGFYDSAHFTRVFQRETGMTPRQYRQACNREADVV